MRRALLWQVLPVVVLCCMTGCGTTAGTGDVVTPLARFTLPPQGARFVAGPDNTSDPQYYGLVVDVPPGAVAAPVEITLARSDRPADPGTRAAGPAFRLLPQDAPLLQPVQIDLPYDSDGVSLFDELSAVVGGGVKVLDNPLRRFVGGQARPRPFRISTSSLGEFASLIRLPTGLPGMGIAGADKIDSIDILFVIDNSPSMAPKQMALIQQFPAFVKKILACKGLSLHVGFNTTDLGIAPTAAGWPDTSVHACNTDKGDDGKLQSTTCIDDASVDYYGNPRRKDANCSAVCKSNTHVGGGKSYIEINKDGTSNLPSGTVDVNEVTDAFSCIAYQGSAGCGIEMPLESAKRALNDPGDKTFWRFSPTALQVLVIVTDEDDCSVADRNLTNPAGTMDLKMGMTPGPMNFGINFRCFALSNKCDQPLTMPGMNITNCQSPGTTPGYLENISSMGGLAETILGARKVLITGIWPMMPTYEKLAGVYPSFNASTIHYAWGPGYMGTQFLDFQRHACNIPGHTSPDEGAAEQNRLSEFADYSWPGAYQADICEPSQYADVLDILADALGHTMKMTCK